MTPASPTQVNAYAREIVETLRRELGAEQRA
jgi:hypothetical protein